MSNTIDRLLDISSRLEHLETAAEWIARETTQRDAGISQTATLITVLADEIREKTLELVQELELMISRNDKDLH